MLNKPFFFDRRGLDCRAGKSWSRHVQRGRTFHTEEKDGLTLWNAVAASFCGQGVSTSAKRRNLSVMAPII